MATAEECRVALEKLVGEFEMLREKVSQERADVLRQLDGVRDGLRAVDAVVVFDDDEPRDLIAAIEPDVLVKGKDWAHYVSGREIVEANGGKVVLAEMVPGLSTTNIINRIVAGYR